MSIRVITSDVARLAGFYEQATGVPALWSGPEFAEISTGRTTLAIASTRAMQPSDPVPPARRTITP
jgi:hypothetical protein